MFYKWNYVTWGDDTPSESHKLSNKKPSTIRGKEISPNCWSRKCGTLPKIQPIAIDFGFLSEVECKSLLLKRPPTLCIGLGYFPPCQDNDKTSFFESTKVTLSFFYFCCWLEVRVFLWILDWPQKAELLSLCLFWNYREVASCQVWLYFNSDKFL